MHYCGTVFRLARVQPIIHKQKDFVGHRNTQRQLPQVTLNRYKSSVFDVVKPGPPIEVFALNKAFAEDKDPNKANLGVGAYRTNEGKPWVLPVVRATEKKIASDEKINHEYLSVLGNEMFRKAATALLLGDNSKAVQEKRVFGVQTLSGTGALRLGADFLTKIMGRTDFYCSDPTWENHSKVFLDAGFKNAHEYRYWDYKKRIIDIDGLLEDLCQAPEGAVIILHACAHNPTGMDPSQEQWKQIADVIEGKNLFPFFDSAYQGFASGDPDNDAWAVRYFVDRGFELVCSQSFAKNFGLYCERIGNLTVVQQSPKTTAAVQSQFTLVVRGAYSNPPAFGSRIVGTVLSDPKLKGEWMESIATMSCRIRQMREALVENLKALNTPGNWDHIVKQIGMFSYTGLNEQQVGTLIKDFHVYLLKTGRVNMCGVNDKNVKHIAKAINAAVSKK
ncbi:aspartate aminotransferase, cytoplasmic-like [Teleopsis dalmanni]|uniref:aspartate aminotransferase, cytoplasmic-like n=1 Tax=Teleopsis dalmanni TaxID=139649 RepID=UPI0018CDA0E1|nr:aspartate aminotransferase, cytoplasmic-like [Teleopsis dalmanni]XP_037940038.1 aspartate aminotransferase, cytoplasmic-like [Teleopsis dalmanni]